MWTLPYSTTILVNTEIKNIKLNIYAYICINVYTHTIYRHTYIDIHAHACIQKDAKRPKDLKAIR